MELQLSLIPAPHDDKHMYEFAGVLTSHGIEFWPAIPSNVGNLPPTPEASRTDSDLQQSALEAFKEWGRTDDKNRYCFLIVRPSGDFIIQAGQALSSLGLGGIIGAWLTAKYGRKVRLKVGEIEAEAHTPEEVEKLLARAQEIQQRNQPKVIHEP